MPKFPFLVLAIAISVPAVWAQSQAPAPERETVPDPQKIEIAKKIFEADGFDKLAKLTEQQTLTRTYAVMAQNPMYPRGFLQELSKKMTERTASLDLQGMLLPTYANRFSADELRQILAFVSSPVGQKLASSETAILAEIQPELTMWSRKTGQEVTRQILTEHPEWLRQITESRQRQNAETLAATAPGDGASNEAVHWNSRDMQPPQIITKSDPQYSDEALKAKMEGSVTISLTVGSDGAPRDVKVVRPLGMGLDQKAMESVQTWRWKPAMKAGVPVATRATVEVNFRLTGQPTMKN